MESSTNRRAIFFISRAGRMGWWVVGYLRIFPMMTYLDPSYSSTVYVNQVISLALKLNIKGSSLLPHSPSSSSRHRRSSTLHQPIYNFPEHLNSSPPHSYSQYGQHQDCRYRWCKCFLQLPGINGVSLTDTGYREPWPTGAQCPSKIREI